MEKFVGIVLIIGSIVLGILFARTGTKPKNMTIRCPYCGTELPYKEVHKMACPNCRRAVRASDMEWSKKYLQKPSTRFFIGFMIGAILTLIIMAKLFGADSIT